MEYRTGVRGLEGRRKRGEEWEEGRVGRGKKRGEGRRQGRGKGAERIVGKKGRGEDRRKRRGTVGWEAEILDISQYLRLKRSHDIG